MNMDAFRWVLLIIGIVIFLLIFFLSKRKSSAPKNWNTEKITPGFEEPEFDIVHANDDQPSLDVLAENMQLYHEDADEVSLDNPVKDSGNIEHSSTGARSKIPDVSSEKLIALYLVEKHGGMLSGSDIIESLEQAGMRYGDMKIFHYFSDHDNVEAQPVFSIANLVDPGWFDLISIDKIRTPGLTLFMRLPGPVNSIRAFDEMVVVIDKLEKLLPVALKDKSRNKVSKQMLAHMREEVVEFDRMRAMPSQH